ncbi:hypothetical protein MRX96_040002 [Rhipicephalus microplus]
MRKTERIVTELLKNGYTEVFNHRVVPRWGKTLRHVFGVFPVNVVEIWCVNLATAAILILLVAYTSNVLPWNKVIPLHPLFLFKVVLIDDPTLGLDRSNTRLVWDTLLRVRPTSALLISTHDMTEADVLADRVIGLTKGTVVCNASPTYLKSLYGVGYKVRLKKSAKVPFQEQHALSILRSYAPSAEVLDDHPSQAIVGLHTVVSKDFDRMFHELERASFHLGIRSIGLTVSTL